MWFIGVEVEQETSAPPPKKNPGCAPVYDIRTRLLSDEGPRNNRVRKKKKAKWGEERGGEGRGLNRPHFRAVSKQKTCKEPESKTGQKMARVKERGGVEIGYRSISCVAKKRKSRSSVFQRKRSLRRLCTQSLFILMWKERRLNDTVARGTHWKGRRAISFIPSMTPRVP